MHTVLWHRCICIKIAQKLAIAPWCNITGLVLGIISLVTLNICVHVCACMFSDVLYEQVYESISGDATARRVFLECLERYLLSGRLATMRPAIAQDFVTHFEQHGLLQSLEACLCVLDISCLDLHQVHVTMVTYCCHMHVSYRCVCVSTLYTVYNCIFDYDQ